MPKLILVFWLRIVISKVTFFILVIICDFTDTMILVLLHLFIGINAVIASGRIVNLLSSVLKLLFIILLVFFILFILFRGFCYISMWQNGFWILDFNFFGARVFDGYSLGLHLCGDVVRRAVTFEAMNI